MGYKGYCAMILCRLPLALGKSYIVDFPGLKNRITASISLMAEKSSILSTETDVIKICPHGQSSPLPDGKDCSLWHRKRRFLVKGVPACWQTCLCSPQFTN